MPHDDRFSKLQNQLFAAANTSAIANAGAISAGLDLRPPGDPTLSPRDFRNAPLNLAAEAARPGQIDPTGAPIRNMQSPSSIIDIARSGQPLQARPAPSIATLDENQVKQTKGLAKALSNVADILSNPATIKGLAQFGYAIGGPNSVGGRLAPGTIEMAEGIAQQRYLADLEAGVDPGQARAAGLSPEGRAQITSAFLQQQNRERVLGQGDRELDIRERGVAVDEQQAETRERLALSEIDLNDIRGSVAERGAQIDSIRAETEQKAVQSQIRREGYLNLLSQAQARALDAETAKGKSDIFEEVNKVRFQLREDLVDENLEIDDRISTLEEDLETAENLVTGFFGGALKRGVRIGEPEKKELESQVTALKNQISRLNTLKESNQSTIETLLEDVAGDVQGRSDFVPVGGTRTAGTRTRGKSTAPLRPASEAEALAIPDGVRYITRKGNAFVNVNGRPQPVGQ